MEQPAKALDLGEVARRLANVVRPCAIAEVDLQRARARASFGEDPRGAPVLTGWLPWMASAAGEDRDWRPPSVGERAVLLAPYGELSVAFILCGAYRDKSPAPESAGTKRVTEYRDGARIEYDSAAHALKAVLPAGATAELEADGGITITGPVTITGNVGITGELTATGNVSADGKVAAKGNVEAKGDVSDKAGSMQGMRNTYDGHVHGVPPAPVTATPAPTHLMN